MRKTREELLEMFPSWNEAHNDIVATFYGDKPLYRWDKGHFKKFYEDADSTIQNVEGVDAYIWTMNGDFDQYRLLQGDLKIAVDGQILCGDFNIHYSGQTYTIVLNEMYGYHRLKIYRIHTNGSGGLYAWANYPCGKKGALWQKINFELNPEIIDKVFNHKEWDDYGEPVLKFRDWCKELYESDQRNRFKGTLTR